MSPDIQERSCRCIGRALEALYQRTDCLPGRSSATSVAPSPSAGSSSGNLKQALEEATTLRRIQDVMQSLTGGVAYNTWDKRMTGPE